MTMVTNTQRRGPFIYENWRAERAGVPPQGASEHPLFTDAHIVGEITDGYGPYQLLNTVPLPFAPKPAPAIVLRMEHHFGSILNLGEAPKTNVEHYHGSSPSDEIASVVSLCLGIRLKAGGSTRRFEIGGDPRGHPQAFEAENDPVLLKRSDMTSLLPGVLGGHSLTEASLLSKLPDLLPDQATALVHASRLYQDAMWIAESEPELSWIMLVSAIEVAAGYWRAEKESPAERVSTSQVGAALGKLLENTGNGALFPQISELIADYMGSTKKFVDFVGEFLPEPPSKRPPQIFQCPWDQKSMREAMRTIYSWRSHALHGGTPFPLPMCLPPRRNEDWFDEKPLGLAMSNGNAIWMAKDTPMLLHTFEYLVRGCLLKWWSSMLPNVNQ